MSSTPTIFACPLCGNVLRKFIRIRNNEHVVFCQREGCRCMEGTGDTFDLAVGNMHERSKAAQPTKPKPQPSITGQMSLLGLAMTRTIV